MKPEDFHYDALSAFNTDYFKGTLNKNHLKEEVAVKNGAEEEFFWQLEKGKTKYLLDSGLQEHLPIKVNITSDVSWKSKVFKHIDNYSSLRFRSEKKMSFRELVDTIAPFEHSNPETWTLYKIIALVSYVGRINVRVCTNAGFGKDSVMNVIEALRNDVSIITPRSMAAIEYRLFNKVIVLNETANIDASERNFIQEFLLRCGDLSNSYEKSTRGSKEYKTQDTYDISKVSLMIFYNTKNYYEKTGQGIKFFDNMFTKAVCDRFFPVLFEGRLDAKQFNIEIPKHVDTSAYVDIIHTIEWFKQKGFGLGGIGLEYGEEEIPESIEGRHVTMWMRIMEAVDEYCFDHPEGEDMYELFYDKLQTAYLQYDQMLHGSSISNYTRKTKQFKLPESGV